MKYSAAFSLIVFTATVFTACNSNMEETGTADTAATMITLSPPEETPLESWNEGTVKEGLMRFVSRAGNEDSTGFIPLTDRIAVFDNDGTLWSEQPLYFQFFYAFDKIRQMAPQHPEWKTKEPYKSVLGGDIQKVLASGEKGLLDIMNTTFGGMSADAFDKSVKEWADTAMNPVKQKKYVDMIYQPMAELLQYLRANGFQTFIVSGGDMAFMRAWAEKAYGIPPQQVVGSSFKVNYDSTGLQRLPQFEFMDDGPGKPVGIYQHIGKKPVFAAGNSDGDYQMLQFTSSTSLPHLCIIIHHTDSTREWAYDSTSAIGRLKKGLDDAPKYGWVLVDMQRDWKKVYPDQE